MNRKKRRRKKEKKNGKNNNMKRASKFIIIIMHIHFIYFNLSWCDEQNCRGECINRMARHRSAAPSVAVHNIIFSSFPFGFVQLNF